MHINFTIVSHQAISQLGQFRKELILKADNILLSFINNIKIKHPKDINEVSRF